MAKVLKIRKRGAEEEIPAKGKAKATVKEGGGKKKDTSGRYKGATTGMGVAEYQNYSLEQNRKRKKSDEVLAREWKKEFPNARADYTAETVNGVRNLYNLGKHANDAPKIPVPKFDDDGQAMPAWGSKAEERRAAAEEKAAAAKKVKKAARK